MSIKAFLRKAKENTLFSKENAAPDGAALK